LVSYNKLDISIINAYCKNVLKNNWQRYESKIKMGKIAGNTTIPPIPLLSYFDYSPQVFLL
jgi:hypothetical protein